MYVPLTHPNQSIYNQTLTLLCTANSSNTHNYIWNATRDNYRESGCVFELEPLYRDGSWQAPNFTSPFFGVDMRFAGDPGPTDWNFGGSSSSSTTSIMATVVPTASPSSGILSSSTTTPVPAVTSSASASSTTSASAQSGLKPAQKTGIGVGVSLGALLLLLCALGLLLIRSRRRRANSKDRVMEQSDPIMKTDIKPPTTSTHRHISGTETLFSELSAQNYDDDSVHKSSSQRPISELMASPPRAELE